MLYDAVVVMSNPRAQNGTASCQYDRTVHKDESVMSLVFVVASMKNVTG